MRPPETWRWLTIGTIPAFRYDSISVDYLDGAAYFAQ